MFSNFNECLVSPVVVSRYYIKTKMVESRAFTIEDYDGTYTLIKRALFPIGLRLMRKDSRLAKICWDTLYWICFASLVMTTGLDFLLLREVLLRERNLQGAMDIFRMMPCVGYMVQGMLKTYKIVVQRSTFENLVDELRSMWPQGELPEDENDVMTKSLKEIHIFVKAFYYSNYILVISITFPAYIDVGKRIFGKETPRVLPYTNWFPFDPIRPVWYEVTLIWQVYETMVTVWTVLAGDLLFCVLLNHVTTQFDLLCVRIQRLFYVPIDKQLIAAYPLGEVSNKKSKDDKNKYASFNSVELNIKHRKDLADIIKRHNTLIRLAKDIEDLFGFAMLFNFFYSSIIICFCGFCSVLVEKWNEFMYKSFLITAFIQTWLLCWYGQKLFESSQRVADALYNSGWYTASQEIKKYILFMIQRSQKSVNVTTYGFSVICLITYTAIIKTSWSYFTLLQNFYKTSG
uniref:Odorant receptor n=1 Tax=Conogethes punctiferalis TaxID=1133088 RepID=A0A1Y9TJI5_CONPF|nr:odorant receptor 30 [Conogethes punctiferalis]